MGQDIKVDLMTDIGMKIKSKEKDQGQGPKALKKLSLKMFRNHKIFLNNFKLSLRKKFRNYKILFFTR